MTEIWPTILYVWIAASAVALVLAAAAGVSAWVNRRRQR
jgi:hypothetical protein